MVKRASSLGGIKDSKLSKKLEQVLSLKLFLDLFMHMQGVRDNTVCNI